MENSELVMVFYWRDNSGAGFSFNLDEDLEPILENEEQRKNYEKCVSNPDQIEYCGIKGDY